MELTKNKLSIISIAAAVLALTFAILGVEGAKVNDGVSGVFWPHINSLLSIFTSRPKEAVVKEVSALPITDTNIITLLLVLALSLSVVAIALGFLAKKLRQNSLLFASPIVLSILVIFYTIPLLNMALQS